MATTDDAQVVAVYYTAGDRRGETNGREYRTEAGARKAAGPGGVVTLWQTLRRADGMEYAQAVGRQNIPTGRLIVYGFLREGDRLVPDAPVYPATDPAWHDECAGEDFDRTSPHVAADIACYWLGYAAVMVVREGPDGRWYWDNDRDETGGPVQVTRTEWQRMMAGGR